MFFVPIGLKGIYFKQRCIQLVREKLTIFPYAQYIIGNVFHWLSEEIGSRSKLDFTRNLQKFNSDFTKK